MIFDQDRRQLVDDDPVVGLARRRSVGGREGLPRRVAGDELAVLELDHRGRVLVLVLVGSGESGARRRQSTVNAVGSVQRIRLPLRVGLLSVTSNQ